MKTADENKSLSNPIISVIMIIAFAVFEILGIIYKGNNDLWLLYRVVARGVFGCLALYNSGFMLFTKKQAFITRNITAKQRTLCGILIGLVGIIMVATAILGYGTNGDPRYIWWE